MAQAVFSLQVTILDGLMADAFVRANPTVSRIIEIRADQTLNQLHRVIFEAFDRWDDCHLHEFHLGRESRDRHARRYVLPFVLDDPHALDDEPAAGSVTQTRIGSLGLEVGSVFWYWYDFGDDWYHEIRVMVIGEAEPKAKYPRVVGRTGESPPQYVNWDEEGDADDGFDELPPPDGEPRPILGWVPVDGDVEAGSTEFADGSVLEWRHEARSPEEVSWVVSHGTGQTYRVTTARELPDGTLIVSTYVVPGAFLNACVQELGRTERETVLSVEVVQR